MPEPTSTSHYAALFDGEKPYFRLATITHPAGTIAGPFLELHQPLVGPVKMSYYNGTTAGLAQLYDVTVPKAAQWLKNSAPAPASGRTFGPDDD